LQACRNGKIVTGQTQNKLLRQKRQQPFFVAEAFPQMSGEAAIKNLIFAANSSQAE
jgi:hypothetical protein